MIRPLLTALAATVAVMAQTQGLPVRSSVSDYPANAQDAGITVAADPVAPDMVRGYFSTDLSDYAVFEVAVWPKQDGTPLDLSTIDFALRIDDRIVRPVEPWNIAVANQKRGQSRANDIVLYPNVGFTTGSWGTGTMVGVGVGVGGGAPGPASTDADRRTMEMELSERALRDGIITKPVAGYVFFPIGNRKLSSYQMEYRTVDGAEIKLTMKAPKTK